MSSSKKTAKSTVLTPRIRSVKFSLSSGFKESLIFVFISNTHEATLPDEEIVKLFYSVDKFNWLKIETVGAGKKYSAVLKELDGRLKVCGGWAVTQLIDAMARSVNAFIPTGLEKIYVEIYRLYQNGNKEEAQLLFEKVLPVLNFSNQNIGTSIRFFKNLRVLEGLFESNYCRYEQAVFSELQEIEAARATSIAEGLLARPG